MSHLHRTQIYIEDEQMSHLKFEASKARVAVSELIRRAVDAFLRRGEQKHDWNKDPLVKAIGKIRLASKDASARHDFYLYGEGKRR
ncbi:MAG: ribbon-helix-helix domain-containing protein [Candidatus Omnitrophica bacterium]|nr:ribbon-helix-helix domain-containing protein [Candidatus Omnitrophota bacterium]